MNRRERLACWLAWYLPWRVVRWSVVRAATMRHDLAPRDINRLTVSQLLSDVDGRIMGASGGDAQ